MLAADNDMGDAIADLAPHKNFLDPNNPRTVSNVATMPKPVASTISNYLSNRKGKKPSEPARAAFMLALAG